MTELKTCITCQDLFEINALLDMQNDINYQMHKKRDSNRAVK